MNAAEYVARLRSREFIGLGNDLPRQVDSAPVAVAERTASIDDVRPVDASELTTFGLVELLLKNRGRLHHVLRDQSTHAVVLPRLLAIALTGFILFGVIMSLVLTVAGRWPSLTPIAAWLEAPSTRLISIDAIDTTWGKLAPWTNGQALTLTFAYAFGLVAASGVALPSLYFYCLLAGIRMSMVEVVVHAVKAKAISAVALIGILPIYVVLAMGAAIFNVGDYGVRVTMMLGLVLPLVAGFWGTASLYQGFSAMCDTMPGDRAANRECFLRRLVLSWSACYSAIMPVMIYSLWAVFSR